MRVLCAGEDALCESKLVHWRNSHKGPTTKEAVHKSVVMNHLIKLQVVAQIWYQHSEG